MAREMLEKLFEKITFRPDWNNAKQIMGEIFFLKRLQEYDVNRISNTTLAKVRPYVDSKDFQPAVGIKNL